MAARRLGERRSRSYCRTKAGLWFWSTITAAAPIDTIPLFIRAGSIVPLGAPILSSRQTQAIASVRIYPGADADFTLFSDDGTSYAYETNGGSVTKLHWDDAKQRLQREGYTAWSGADSSFVQVIHP